MCSWFALLDSWSPLQPHVRLRPTSVSCLCPSILSISTGQAANPNQGSLRLAQPVHESRYIDQPRWQLTVPVVGSTSSPVPGPVQSIPTYTTQAQTPAYVHVYDSIYFIGRYTGIYVSICMPMAITMQQQQYSVNPSPDVKGGMDFTERGMLSLRVPALQDDTGKANTDIS